MRDVTYSVEIIIAGKWTRVHALCTPWSAALIQTDLEYRHGETARVVRDTRDVTRDDMRAARDGIGMRVMSIRQLEALIAAHKDATLFASKVIVKAAQAVIDSRQFS